MYVGLAFHGYLRPSEDFRFPGAGAAVPQPCSRYIQRAAVLRPAERLVASKTAEVDEVAIVDQDESAR
eukprot:10676379-Lingulodinium_polyedra.AAC.1